MSRERVTRGSGLLEAFLARQRTRRADRLIPAELRNGRLLDVGCGSYPFFLVSTRFAEKFGIDQVATSLNSHHREIKVTRQDLGSDPTLPFDDGFFDAVSMLAVYEHVEASSLGRLLEQVHRVLKPNGMFVLTTPAPWAEWPLKVMAVTRLVSSVELEEHKDIYPPGEIETSLEAAGFDRERIRVGYFEMRMNIWATAVR